jgi:hypothetical protein
MASIYISSTYKDLSAHREAVYNQLQRMKHTVIAMEAYVARDDRPADACIRDVAASDLYVGLFAWRYGFIPKDKIVSITELEYLAAAEREIPRLIFMLDEAVAWPPALLDSHTGDGEGGARIRALRARLSEDRLVTFFTSAEDLAAKVAAAVHLAGTVTDASDASMDLAQVVGADAIDRPEMLFNQSYTPYLIQRIAELGNAPLLKIDLRDGAYWWSTRLYAVATLAHEYTAVEWLLFLSRGSDYVGIVRPGDLRRALERVQPELEEGYRQAHVPPSAPGMDTRQRAGQVLQALVSRFAERPGGEESLRFLVSADWISKNVTGLSTAHVERAGPFDLLATFQILQESTPFIPITKGTQLLKVIDRVGVATEIARTAVEHRLGRG